MMKVKFSFFARFSGLIIFALILLNVNLSEVFRAMKKADFTFLGPALLMVLPLYIIKAFRWKSILNSHGIEYSGKDSFLVYLSSNFIAFITPGRLGELAKAFYIKNDTGNDFLKALPSVIADRLFDIYVLSAVALFGISRLSVMSGYIWLRYLLGFILVLMPGILLIRGARMSLLEKIRESRLYRRWKSKVEPLLKELENVTFVKMIKPVILTASAYAILFLSSYFISSSAGIEIDFFSIMYFVAIANILSYLPISVAGFGTREIGFIYLFNSVGLLKEEALAFSFLYFFVFYIGGGVAGFIAYLVKPVSIDLLKKNRSFNE